MKVWIKNDMLNIAPENEQEQSELVEIIDNFHKIIGAQVFSDIDGPDNFRPDAFVFFGYSEN